MTPEAPKTLLDAVRYYTDPKVCFETTSARVITFVVFREYSSSTDSGRSAVLEIGANGQQSRLSVVHKYQIWTCSRL
jgi:hypothetical protein